MPAMLINKKDFDDLLSGLEGRLAEGDKVVVSEIQENIQSAQQSMRDYLSAAPPESPVKDYIYTAETYTAGLTIYTTNIERLTHLQSQTAELKRLLSEDKSFYSIVYEIEQLQSEITYEKQELEAAKLAYEIYYARERGKEIISILRISAHKRLMELAKTAPQKYDAVLQQMFFIATQQQDVLMQEYLQRTNLIKPNHVYRRGDATLTLLDIINKKINTTFDVTWIKNLEIGQSLLLAQGAIPTVKNLQDAIQAGKLNSLMQQFNAIPIIPAQEKLDILKALLLFIETQKINPHKAMRNYLQNVGKMLVVATEMQKNMEGYTYKSTISAGEIAKKIKISGSTAPEEKEIQHFVEIVKRETEKLRDRFLLKIFCESEIKNKEISAYYLNFGIEKKSRLSKAYRFSSRDECKEVLALITPSIAKAASPNESSENLARFTDQEIILLSSHAPKVLEPVFDREKFMRGDLDVFQKDQLFALGVSAIAKKDILFLEKLLDKNPSLLTQKDSEDKTILHHIAIQGDQSTLAVVTDTNGIDLTSMLKVQDKDGKTPYMLAKHNPLLQRELDSAQFAHERNELVKKLVGDALTAYTTQLQQTQGKSMFSDASKNAQEKVKIPDLMAALKSNSVVAILNDLSTHETGKDKPITKFILKTLLGNDFLMSQLFQDKSHLPSLNDPDCATKIVTALIQAQNRDLGINEAPQAKVLPRFKGGMNS